MSLRLKYNSKGAIYGSGYDLALRFIYDQSPFQHDDYPDLEDKLLALCGTRVQEFNTSVSNLHTQYPTSIGCWVSVPAGAIQAVQSQDYFDFVLLGHETGPELFV